MTRKFICRPVSEKDHRGEFVSTGILWTEQATLPSGMARAIAGLGLFFIIVIFLVSVSLAFSRWTQGLGIFLSLFSGGVIILVVKIIFGNLPERSILFMRDGTISAPKGLPREPGLRTLGVRQIEIATIEVGPSKSGQPDDMTKTVLLITRDGRTIAVGQWLHEEQARQISVALTLALKEIRNATHGDVLPPGAAIYGSPSASSDSDLIE